VIAVAGATVKGGTAMARSDLLISLVRASMSGDKGAVRSAVETIIAEEKGKQHKVLADRLTRAMHTNGNGGAPMPVPVPDTAHRGREFIAEINPRRRLDDMVLSDTCRKAVDQLIEEQQRSSLLRAHGLDPRHRVLLVGPPGNGKTSLAEAIAEALAVPFFVVRYEAMIGSYLGETASRLKRVFDYVRTTPCILFFDEFDAVGKERGDIHETGEIKRVVTSLLMHVDDLPSYTVVIAATNHSELLDRAVWRRFQLRLGLPAPTEKDLVKYFERFLSSTENPAGISAPVIAKRLGAISYAEAEEFTLDVRRRDVMTMKERPLKKTIEEQLKLWQERAQPKQNTGDGKGTPSDG
jgi:SpoVK/Ycf46/Vps4 family AAA+-type ATPase